MKIFLFQQICLIQLIFSKKKMHVMLMNMKEIKVKVKNQVEIDHQVHMIGMNMIMVKRVFLEQDQMEVFIQIQEILLNGKKLYLFRINGRGIL